MENETDCAYARWERFFSSTSDVFSGIKGIFHRRVVISNETFSPIIVSEVAIWPEFHQHALLAWIISNINKLPRDPISLFLHSWKHERSRLMDLCAAPSSIEIQSLSHSCQDDLFNSRDVWHSYPTDKSSTEDLSPQNHQNVPKRICLRHPSFDFLSQSFSNCSSSRRLCGEQLVDATDRLLDAAILMIPQHTSESSFKACRNPRFADLIERMKEGSAVLLQDLQDMPCDRISSGVDTTVNHQPEASSPSAAPSQSKSLPLSQNDTQDANRAESAELCNKLQAVLLSYGTDFASDLSQVQSLLDQTIQLSNDQLSAFLNQLPILQLSEDAFALLHRHLMSPDVTLQTRSTYLQHALLLKLSVLAGPAPRMLSNLVTQTATHHPTLLVEQVLHPLCARDSYDVSHAELVNRLIKESLPLKDSMTLLRLISQSSCEDSQTHLLWNDATLSTIGTIFGTAPGIFTASEDVLPTLIAALDYQSKSLCSSIKFAQLIFQLISKHGAQIVRFKDALRSIVLNNQTSLAKVALSALNKVAS
eukprot:TRINITY_DN3222_c0_g2_i6.p2 TRINITY_DN3222_c0_g2~~TRINITY_DN3222_c0_g2_i6.p2  ORF type:complete len:534 (-),score=120.54 TRINITY_DN3222_c0_g2_i6:2073-3674(-)